MEKKMATDNAPPDCVFCNICSRTVPAHIVYEDTETIAFLTNGPLTVGHTLVIPKTHVATIYDIPDHALAAVIKTAKQVANALKTETRADGINIMQNNERAAGQAVFHIHFHVVPRVSGDGYKHWERTREVSEDETNAMATRLRARLTR